MNWRFSFLSLVVILMINVNFSVRAYEKHPPASLIAQPASSIHCNPQSQRCKKPDIQLSDFTYLGGFRISGHRFGENNTSSLNNSRGIFTYHKQHHSIFVIGSPKGGEVAEFAIPELVVSRDIKDFNVVTKARQPFVKINGNPKVETGVDKNFKVTGLEVIDNKLLVNYVNWYDASGKETDTSIYFDDANKLSTSKAYGPFQLDGKAHAAGWISKVPEAWASRLGGQYIAGGQLGTSIISRLSVGPSAFVFDPRRNMFGHKNGKVATERLLDFSLTTPLYNVARYGKQPSNVNKILYNEDGKNDLWTLISGAGYGFIVPGTSTYLTVGRAGGIESGIGYKIRQDSGKLCPGPCSKSAADNYSYYWLWDVEKLMDVKYGLLQAHEVRPYEYGKLILPVDLDGATINGGAFDESSSTLYLSVPKADKLTRFKQLPVFLAFQFKKR